MILITGATGSIGALVVERLLAHGERPRIFVRDEAKARARFGERVDLAVGDLTDGASLMKALKGVERGLLLNAGPELAARDALAAMAARAVGAAHLVKLSTADAAHGVGTGPWHLRGEHSLRESGVGFTFVRPSGFMNNALAWASAVRGGDIVRGATGDGRIPFIHAHDIADVITLALTNRSHDGATLTITGPETLSYGEMVAKIGDALGRTLTFLVIPEDEERQRWLARGETEESVDYHLSIFRAIRDGILSDVTDTIPRLLHRPATSFEQWAQQNVAAFR